MNNSSKDNWLSYLNFIKTLPDMGTLAVVQDPSLIQVMEMGTALTKMIAIVIFFFWALLLIQTYRWSQAQTFVGGVAYSWFVYFNGLVALIGFLFVAALHVGWILLNLERYEKGGMIERGLAWYGERLKTSSSSTLDTFTTLLNSATPGSQRGRFSSDQSIWEKIIQLNPLNYIEVAAKGLRARQELIRTIRYIMNATLMFSLASLSIFFLANPSMSSQLVLVVLGAVGIGVVAVMLNSSGSSGSSRSAQYTQYSGSSE
jgi:hypothetical protein